MYTELFENILGKGGSAGNQHILLFQEFFLSFPKQISIILIFILLSASSLNLVQSKILPFGIYKYTIPYLFSSQFNPLLNMAILGSYDSAANKDKMSKIWTNAII